MSAHRPSKDRRRVSTLRDSRAPNLLKSVAHARAARRERRAQRTSRTTNAHRSGLTTPQLRSIRLQIGPASSTRKALWQRDRFEPSGNKGRLDPLLPQRIIELSDRLSPSLANAASSITTRCARRPRPAIAFSKDQKSMRPPFERRITGSVLELELRIGWSICVRSKYTSDQVICWGANQAHSSPCTSPCAIHVLANLPNRRPQPKSFEAMRPQGPMSV